jgi:hypothetical protein
VIIDKDNTTIIEGAGKSGHAARRHAKAGAAHEGERGDAIGPLNGEGLGDSSAHAMADNHGALNAEVVEQGENGGGIGTAGGASGARWVAASVAGKVNDDEAMPGRKVTSDSMPESGGQWEAVQENHRISGASCSGGVVVKPHSAHIHELTAHQVNLVLSWKNGILSS